MTSVLVASLGESSHVIYELIDTLSSLRMVWHHVDRGQGGVGAGGLTH